MNELTPITRIEKYLDGIVNGSEVPDQALARVEIFLNAIKNNEVCALTPMTREEMFLAKISGANVVTPTPVTRIEIFLAKIAGADIETPEPVTRVEYWLDEWANGGVVPEYATASGAIASFETVRSAPLRRLEVEIEPVQEGSGDPSPDNVCPISGWTGAKVERDGKNLWNKDRPDAENGYYFLTGEFHADNNYRCLAFPCTQNDKFTKSGSGWGGIATFWNEETFVSGVNRTSVTVPSGANIVKFACQYSSTDAQLERGSTATDYEPYTGSTIPVNWQAEAGTVYGGTLDVVSGVLTVEAILEVFDQISGDGIQSQIDYCFSNTGVSTVGDYTRVAFGVRDDIQRSDYNLVSSSYNFKMCNMLKHYFAYNDESAHWYRNTSLYAFFPSLLVGTTATSVISYLTSIKDTNPLSIWTPLTTPITYQLTPQQISSLLGQNNIWSDAGSVTVEYQSN